LVHFLFREQSRAIVVGEPRGITGGPGHAAQDTGYGDAHDEGCHQNFQKRETALVNGAGLTLGAARSDHGALSSRVNSVKGSTLTSRLVPARFAISIPMRGMAPPGYMRKRRGSSGLTSAAGRTERMRYPSGSSRRRENSRSGERAIRTLSLGAIHTSITCSRRPARSMAVLRKLTT